MVFTKEGIVYVNDESIIDWNSKDAAEYREKIFKYIVPISKKIRAAQQARMGYEDGMKYDGEFVGNKKEGKGIFYWDEKTKWEGNWAV